MTTPDKSVRASKAPRVNLKDLKKLIDMMRKAELSEVNIEQEGLKIALRKDEKPVMAAPMAMPVQMAAPAAAPAPAPASAAPASAPAPAPAAAPAYDGQLVSSPMVGTLYRSPSPDAPFFVKEGQKVEVGQTVCIIEAMKLMNEIKAESAGTITKFMVENAQAVEFGQPLYVIK
ncbi:MAG TPA: acetyl-CoA carboxylase biotin carboxyl carrier protein [bacterium]|jgi:acetyl-CoA carboxylase biotin carboxyl carrier protein|nr:acetyl-CoA carboxylase biotin carboxyl carrier protein [bacterium]